MRKLKVENVPQHQDIHEPRKAEKIGLVSYFTVRRHSRVLYLPLDPMAVRLHDVQKGDIIKARIIEVRKAARPDEPLREPQSKAESSEWSEEE